MWVPLPSRAKVSLRRIREEFMPQPSHQPPQPLEVMIVFEPTRAAPEVQHEAYSVVLPTPRRTLARQQQGADRRPEHAADGSRP